MYVTSLIQTGLLEEDNFMNFSGIIIRFLETCKLYPYTAKISILRLIPCSLQCSFELVKYSRSFS